MPEENSNYPYKFTIILTTYQSFSSIAHSLNNVLLQNFPQDDYEIIAISHGVPDAVSGYLFNTIKQENLKTINVDRNPEMPYAPCIVRNKGIQKSEGKLVLFLHDNVDLIGSDWLSRMWQQSNEGERAVMTRKIVYRYNKDGTYRQSNDISGFYAQQDSIPLKYLKMVNGFDEIYDGDNGYDDIDLMKRCQQHGCEFHLDSNLMSVKHNLRDMYPEQKTISNGARNRQILLDRGFG